VQQLECHRNEKEAQALIDCLTYNGQYDPHAILGLHIHDEKHSVIRLWRPGAKEIFLEFKGKVVQASLVHEAGLFEYIVPKNTTYKDYRVFHSSGLSTHDPYSFWPTFGEIDRHLFTKGVHYELHRKMGARCLSCDGVDGVAFTVWAPSAKSVSLVCDTNHFDGRVNPMRSLGSSGVWELFMPGLTIGEKYKFEIQAQSGELCIKSDPFALSTELRPKSASIVSAIDDHIWQDHEWMQNRAKQTLNRPINIYEVHLGSWKRKDNAFLSYRELAVELAEYCKNMGYTHVELLPIAEHPLDESWGYQVTGFFAVTSRFGTPQDFQFFVDHMHKNNIGVIVDWVPGHFPTDDFALSRFDGTCLYEHEDPRQGFHPHWNTAIFNFGRLEVSNFLLASSLLWLDAYHVDGLRVDAVASMLYLDYGRDEGAWIPNKYGAKENLEAIEFLKHANSVIHDRHPGVLTIAEESTAFAGISHPLEYNGIGFDFKWNMGWMNDTLRYITKDSFFRTYHHNDVTFGLLYAFTEKFVLVFSHDEVVHGKRSLLSKMPGDLWQKFANVRLLLSYQICQPGKKLLFMGGEIGQWNEWYCNTELDWMLLEYPMHQGLQECVKECNHLYLHEEALYAEDLQPQGFEWIDFHDEKNSVIAYLRKGNGKTLLCVHNFTPQYHPEYDLSVQGATHIEECFNTDDTRFGGSGKSHGACHLHKNEAGRSESVTVSIAPLATTIYRVWY